MSLLVLALFAVAALAFVLVLLELDWRDERARVARLADSRELSPPGSDA